MKEIMKADETAEMLRISRSGLYSLVAKGDVPAIRLFGRRNLRFKRADIERLLMPEGCEYENHVEIG